MTSLISDVILPVSACSGVPHNVLHFPVYINQLRDNTKTISYCFTMQDQHRLFIAHGGN